MSKNTEGACISIPSCLVQENDSAVTGKYAHTTLYANTCADRCYVLEHLFNRLPELNTHEKLLRYMVQKMQSNFMGEQSELLYMSVDMAEITCQS